MSLNFPNYLSPPKLRKSLQYCLNYTIYASETYADSYKSVISFGIPWRAFHLKTIRTPIIKTLNAELNRIYNIGFMSTHNNDKR